MKISGYVLLAFLFTIAVPQAVSAEITTSGNATARIVPAGEQKCAMKSNSNVNVNLNEFERDILKVKTTLDGKVAEIKALAKEAGVSDIEIQSLNYNANSRSSGGGCNAAANANDFQTYANISFTVKPGETAAAFASLLVSKGYNASFNVSMYRQCGGYAGPQDEAEGD